MMLSRRKSTNVMKFWMQVSRILKLCDSTVVGEGLLAFKAGASSLLNPDVDSLVMTKLVHSSMKGSYKYV